MLKNLFMVTSVAVAETEAFFILLELGSLGLKLTKIPIMRWVFSA
jgi:hypothetical protein